jgi:hypothetical protein
LKKQTNMTENKTPAPIHQQHNVITKARYNYTLIEKRIIYHILIQLKKQEIADNQEITIPLHELTKDSKIEHVQRSSISLLKKIFEIKDPVNKSWTATGILQYITIENGMLKTEIAKKIKPYLLTLGNFTRLNIEIAVNLKSVHTQRLYEICCQYRDGKLKYRPSIEELKQMMMIEDKYSSYGHFKSRVLGPARKELKQLYENNESDIMFNYHEHKTSRQITHILFEITSKEKDKQNSKITANEVQDFTELYIKPFWPNNPTRIHQVFNYIHKKQAWITYKTVVNDICNRKNNQGKPLPKIAGLLVSILKKDHQIYI